MERYFFDTDPDNVSMSIFSCCNVYGGLHKLAAMSMNIDNSTFEWLHTVCNCVSETVDFVQLL